MKKTLLTSLLLASAMIVSAAVPGVSKVAATSGAELTVNAPAKTVAKPKMLKKVADGNIVMAQYGDRTLKKIAAPSFSTKINPLRRSAAKSSLPNGTILYESFENPGSDIDWVPEGWTVESKGDPNLGDFEKWTPTQADDFGFLPTPTDGEWMFGIDYSFEALHQDEWLISPEVTVPEEGDYELTYDLYLDPFFFFKLDGEHFDWDEWEYIDQEIAYTIQVLISVDGGDFEVLHDFAQDYIGKTATELGEDFVADFYPQKEDLSAYNGKKIKVAFRYVGEDGQTEFIDNVRIALPQMDLVLMPPFSTQYFGLTPDADFGTLTVGIATYPVYSPVTFWNYTWEDYDYTWHYFGSDNMWNTSDDPDELTIQYEPDYSDDFTKRNNLYYPPYLTATAEGFSDGHADMKGVTYLQAGGKAEFAEGQTIFDFGFLPFEAHHYKVGVYTVDAPEFGERATPIFGHDKNTEAFWTDYTFGEDKTAGDKCEVVAILNYIYPSEDAALVFDKAWIHAMGIFEEDAEFTLEVFDMIPHYDEDGDWDGDIPNDVAFAKATIKGSEAVGTIDPDYIMDFALVFNFDEPVVLDSEKSSAYIVKLSGFCSDKVTWFVPYQQWRPGDLALGWVEKEIVWMGQTRTSITPIANHENEYGDMMCAFDINLGGWYPWLEAEDQTVELGSDRTGEIKLATYYNGEDLTFETSPWLEATATGRYDECVVTVDADAATESREGFVTVSAPGVESKTFKVTQGISAIGALEAPGRSVKTVHTPAGTVADLSTPGVYIITYTDGSVEKKIVK